jgi:hypothetical protein
MHTQTTPTPPDNGEQRRAAANLVYPTIRGKQARALFTLMFRGGEYTTLGLMQALHIADPRGVISQLRKHFAETGGKFHIRSRWIHEDGHSYKMYRLE